MSTLRKAHTLIPLQPHIYVFYSPFPHGSQREATVRLLPHSVNTVTTRQTWADLVMLNRGFSPTSDQHWIAALPPPIPSLRICRQLLMVNAHPIIINAAFQESSVRWWQRGEQHAWRKRKSKEEGGAGVGGWGVKIHYIYTHTDCLAGWLSNRNCKSFPLYLHHLLFSELHLFYPQKKKQNQTKTNKQTKQKRRRRLTTGWTTRLKTKTRTRRDDLNLHNRLLTCVSPPSPSPPPPSPNNIHSNWHTMPLLKKKPNMKWSRNQEEWFPKDLTQYTSVNENNIQRWSRLPLLQLLESSRIKKYNIYIYEDHT